MGQHALLLIREQAIAPIEGGRQRSMPGQSSPSASCKDGKAIVETGSNLAEPQLRDSGGGELKRKRYSVKPPTYLRDYGQISPTRFEAR